MIDPAAVIRTAVLSDTFRRGTFGGPRRTPFGTGGLVPCPWVRVTVRAVSLRGEPHLQFSYFDGKKDFAKNFTRPDAEAPLAEILLLGYAGIHLETAREVIDIRTTKKGKVFVGRKQTKEHAAIAEPHNRVKDVPLPEGRADKLLEVMGIATADGRVRPTMRAKFTQINEFL